MPWRLATGAYALAWLAVLGGLAGELLLVLQRRVAAERAHGYAESNVFTQSQGLAEGATLWQDRGVRYRPGARLTLEVAGTTYEVVTNARGFRTQEFEVPKPAGRLRVVCVGGSTTVQGRTNQETYPAILEQLLRLELPDQAIEVLNLGINGTGTGYWLTRQEELFSYQPDLIVQYNFVNDLFWELLPEYGEAHPWRRQLGRSLLLSAWFPLDAEDLDSGLLRTVRRHRALARQARRRGVAYVAGTFAGPDPTTCSPELRAYLDQNVEAWGQPLALRRYRDYHRVLARYDTLFENDARGRLFPLVLVHRLVSDGRLFVDLCHMSPEGIEALARAFLPAVAEALRDAGRARSEG